MQEFTNEHIGQTIKVLFENRNRNGMMEGYTDNYIRKTAPFSKEWENRIVDWVV